MIGVFVLMGILSGAQAAPPAVGQLTGQVVDGENKPVADARVTLVGGQFSAPPSIPRVPLWTTTDQDGRYSFNDLAPGTYRIDVQKAGFAFRFPGPDSPPPASVAIVAGQSVETPVVVLQRGGAIAGRVLDPSGEPLVGARVSALRSMSPSRAMYVPIGQSAQTNDLGEFRIFGLPPGEFLVQAAAAPDFEPPGTVPQERATLLAPTYYPGTREQGEAKSVTVDAGRTTAGISIQMILTPAFRISGFVLDEAGEPVANAVVMVMPDRSAGFTPMIAGRPGQVRTDAAGAFTAPNLPAGAYSITAALPVVTSGRDQTAAFAGGAAGGFSSGVTGYSAVGGFAMTEVRNGVIIQYRGDPSSAVRVTVDRDSVENVRVVVHRP